MEEETQTGESTREEAGDSVAETTSGPASPAPVAGDPKIERLKRVLSAWGSLVVIGSLLLTDRIRTDPRKEYRTNGGESSDVMANMRELVEQLSFIRSRPARPTTVRRQWHTSLPMLA
jgi:hypothetical protein